MAAKSTFTFLGVDKITPELKNIQKSLASFDQMFKKVGGAMAGYFSAAAVVDFTKQSVDAFIENQKALRTLEAQFKTSSSNIGLSFMHLKNLANELEGVTGIDDNEIMKSMSILQTFGNVTGDVFDEAIKQSTNMAAIFGSTDLAAKQLGDALNDPVNGLSKLDKAQITFTDSEKKHYEQLVANGNLYEAQMAILDKVKEKYEGVGASVNSGPIKASNDLANAWDDSMKNFGQAAMEFAMPVIEELTNRLNSLNAATTVGKKTTYQSGLINDLYAATNQNVRTKEEKAKRDQLIAGLNANLEKSGFNIDEYISAYRIKVADVQKVIANVKKGGADDATIRMWQEEEDKLDAELHKYVQIQNQVGLVAEAKKKEAQATANQTAKKTYEANKPTTDVKDEAWAYQTSLMQEFYDRDEEARKQKEQDEADAWAYQNSLMDEFYARDEEYRKKQEQDEADALRKLNEDYQQTVGRVMDIANAVQSLYATWTSMEADRYAAEIEHMKNELDTKESNYSIELQTRKSMGQDTTQLELDHAREVAAEKEAIAEKEKEAKIKAWEANKQAQLFQATMSTANAVISALGAFPFGPWNLVEAGVVGALGAAQIGLIASQPAPQFANGGIVPGNSFSGDNVWARLNSGEMVLNTGQQSRLFNQLNSGSGSGAIVVQVNGNIIGDTSDNLAKEINRRIKRLKDEGRISA